MQHTADTWIANTKGNSGIYIIIKMEQHFISIIVMCRVIFVTASQKTVDINNTKVFYKGVLPQTLEMLHLTDLNFLFSMNEKR